MHRVFFSIVAVALLLGAAGTYADARVAIGNNGANANGANGGPAFGANGGVNIGNGGTQIANGANAVGANGANGATGANGGNASTRGDDAFIGQFFFNHF